MTTEKVAATSDGLYLLRHLKGGNWGEKRIMFALVNATRLMLRRQIIYTEEELRPLTSEICDHVRRQDEGGAA